LVCTKDRPEDLLRAVRSLLASEGVELELIVVDQSDGSATEEALMSLPPDGRIRFVRSERRGKGAAMNEGLRLAQSELVVCTDDDCEAPPEWVAGMATILIEKPWVGAVFSNVVAGPHDRTVGYIPWFGVSADRTLHRVLSAPYMRGLGAGMAVRRGVVAHLGGVDEALGPGARFPSADESDIATRMLLRGWSVYQASGIAIVHHGFRTMAEGRETVKRDWGASGAAMGKLVRSGHPSVFVLALWTLADSAVRPLMNDLLHLRRPRGFSKIISFSRGFVLGCRSPVDRRSMTFRHIE
jgi:glycosyltransferase involved in cell wall biosynthesis